MSSRFDQFVSPAAPVPAQTWAWNMYGAGVEGMGRDGKPELLPVPEPNDDQLLVRVDAVGMCFSDVKLIKQGGEHPKLYHRDLKTNPTRLGHEATLTVMKVGKNLQSQYHVGQRLALQPDIYDRDGRSTAYGYTIPGGLIQYHVLGAEVLSAGTDGQTSYVIPVEGNLGYAAAALTEPWACVEGAYTQRRRLDPLSGGAMWIVGHTGDTTAYTFSKGLDAPTTIILTDVPASVKERVELEATTRHITVIERNGLSVANYPQLRDLTNGVGFDDIIMLDPRSATAISEAAKLIARRGTFNMVGRTPLDGLVQIDVGRIHYDYTAYLGNCGPDIAASYGEAHNRADLQPGGVAVFVGAGGPMGQMHVQRAIELKDGPHRIIATDLNAARLATLGESFSSLAEANGKELILINPAESTESLRNFVLRHTDGHGADDVIVSVPVASVMAEAATLMNPNGMLVFFAGVPNGTFAPLDMNLIYLHNAQYTGTSGSRVSDQALVIDKSLAHQLSPNRSVAAIGGLEAATDGMEAMMAGRYAGKIVIFPQLSGLPLIGLSELKDKYPDIAEALGPGDVWTAEAERRLIEKFWTI